MFTQPETWVAIAFVILMGVFAYVGVHRTLIEHVRRHILAGDRDLPRLARNTRTAGKKALEILAHGLADYGR